MNYTCIELKGALYQPEDIYELNDSWIIPATEGKSVSEIKNLKLIHVRSKNEIDINFIFSYQFLFLKSNIYYWNSLPQRPKLFQETKRDLNSIVKKYQHNGGFKIDFDKIDIFHTNLPIEINFKEFFNVYIEKYKTDGKFNNIMDLFLYTIGSHAIYYNNIFQKIAQLQTVFETITGNPESKQCPKCKRDRYVEEWKPYLTKRLSEKGIISQNEIDLMITIKMLLNNQSRVRYIHHSSQLNTWQKTLHEIKTGDYHHKGEESYSTNLDDILTKRLKANSWSGLDWENVYSLYGTLVKRLIFFEYLGNWKDWAHHLI